MTRTVEQLKLMYDSQPLLTKPSDFAKWFSQFDSNERIVVATFVYISFTNEHRKLNELIEQDHLYFVRMLAGEHSLMNAWITNN